MSEKPFILVRSLVAALLIKVNALLQYAFYL
ncbi:hypothetical protein CPS_3231 [Colwellia psychrerythraea 34H]|uniref:Uncharacterized protein n=1 Tax=Colwellia psychrerythraea (strain 34H / ATCC BAA-681) TaxID=167879 RepID=Q47Z49_COLP3|nr:hypothetical protein CPS_3231 [Colwellia psychrerythraea 34H]